MNKDVWNKTITKILKTIGDINYDSVEEQALLLTVQMVILKMFENEKTYMNCANILNDYLLEENKKFGK